MLFLEKLTMLLIHANILIFIKMSKYISQTNIYGIRLRYQIGKKKLFLIVRVSRNKVNLVC